MSHSPDSPTAHPNRSAALVLAALGVVYGDIGTSPLYAFRECFGGHHSLAPSHDNILGVLSLIVWSLIIVISIKYLVFIMRADNRGEGGILALMALVTSPGKTKDHAVLVAFGLFGAALLYGDGIITPAISVLSAVEGIEIATPVFHPYILPVAIVIIFGIFFFQKLGTAGVGAVFGPITAVWFVVLGLLGVNSMLREPAVLSALFPWYGIDFFLRNGWHGFLVLGSVFLVVTGGEALYADMGHFGRFPIRTAWFSLVLPGLTLNYFGQGALLLENPAAAANPFYYMAPQWALIPLLVLATIATCIASQAVISGAFSLTGQAVQLGYLPRVDIKHTSARERGQIYIPGINWLLMIGCIWLVLEFKTSSALAAAYGVAVTATMGITTVLFYFVAVRLWNWPAWRAGLLCGVFLVIDLAFFGANIVKVADGGWFPLAVGALIFLVMSTWKTGRRILSRKVKDAQFPIDLFLKDIERNPPLRVRGTAVFMNREADGIPPALLHNLKHNQVIHDQVVFLTVITEGVPHATATERLTVTPLGQGFFRITIRYGFMEQPDIPLALSTLNVEGLKFEPMRTTYFLGRETLIAARNPGMALWREHLFARMLRNETTATAYFSLPPNRVVELGAQIEL